MSAVIAALFESHAAAEKVRTELVKDGFPTDRTELTSTTALGQAELVPAPGRFEKLDQHFRTLFPAAGDLEAIRFLCQAILEGRGVVVVQPRGDIEIRRAAEILERGGALELRGRDLHHDPFERAAAPGEQTVIPNIRKVLLNPTLPPLP